MKRIVTLFFVVSFALYGWSQHRSNGAEQTSLLEPVSETFTDLSIFEQEDPLNITLKYDITSFIRHKAKGEYLPAELTLQLNDSSTIKKNIRLKARGNFRKGHCFFPPIYLNFKTDPLQNKELEGIRKIKLVTHCSTSKAYRNYILREYLVYKMYNIFSEKSFRVRLLQINYIDTGKKGRNYRQMGFMIEPIELLAKRTNSVEVDGNIVLGRHIIENELDRVALFNYLIANTDWRFKGGHNMKYLKSLQNLSNLLTPVPYDFDYAGFVGASYAIPQEWTSIDNIKQREYLGYCHEEDVDYEQSVHYFIARKKEIMETINSFEYFTEKERKNLIDYLEQFYELTEKPKVLIGILKRECRDEDF